MFLLCLFCPSFVLGVAGWGGQENKRTILLFLFLDHVLGDKDSQANPKKKNSLSMFVLIVFVWGPISLIISISSSPNEIQNKKFKTIH